MLPIHYPGCPYRGHRIARDCPWCSQQPSAPQTGYCPSHGEKLVPIFGGQWNGCPKCPRDADGFTPATPQIEPNILERVTKAFPEFSAPSPTPSVSTEPPLKTDNPWHLFHHLWTKAVGTSGYIKQEWRDLEAVMVRAKVAAGDGGQPAVAGTQPTPWSDDRAAEAIIAICGTFIPGGWEHPGDECVRLIRECIDETRSGAAQGTPQVEGTPDAPHKIPSELALRHWAELIAIAALGPRNDREAYKEATGYALGQLRGFTDEYCAAPGSVPHPGPQPVPTTNAVEELAKAMHFWYGISDGSEEEDLNWVWSNSDTIKAKWVPRAKAFIAAAKAEP